MAKKPLLFDLSQIDLGQTYMPKEAIQKNNPQRYEFDLVDRIVFGDPVHKRGLACTHLAADAWWTRGHIPGRPLFPGVLMIETAAQTAGCLIKVLNPELQFIGFIGVEEAKFRGQVVPPGDYYTLSEITDVRRRMFTCACQGVYQDEVVFEGSITGMQI